MSKILIIILLLLTINLFGSNLDNLKYGPIPFSPLQTGSYYSGKFAVYGDIDKDTNIEYVIFTFTGALVYKGNSSKTAGAGNQILLEWDGKNKDGRYVADGGYIMQIKSGNIIKFLKVLVIKDN